MTERRIRLSADTSNRVVSDLNEPLEVPQSYDSRIRLFYDIVALRFQADITRFATMMGARHYTGAAYPLTVSDLFPTGGTTGSFHGMSRHQDNPAIIAQFATVNRYHVSTMAYMANKLNSIPDGDGTARTTH